MTATRTLHRMSTVDALADALRREILDGDLPAGAWLRERELCGAYGVARHSLRSALRQLAADGLVRIEPHRGARVAQLTPDDVRALYELRAALSGEMRLFLLALKPHLPPDRLAAEHATLVRDLERDGPQALREHLRAAAATLADA